MVCASMCPANMVNPNAWFCPPYGVHSTYAGKYERARYERMVPVWRSCMTNPPLQIGMSEPSVRNTCLGSPSRVNRTVNALGTDDQWVYEWQKYHVYAYFLSGTLYAFQNSKDD